jgi:hypothetical protein
VEGGAADARHTEDTAHIWVFDPGFIFELVRAVSIPVMGEGRIWTREEAQARWRQERSPFIVGSAVTRPCDIARRFADAIGAGKDVNNSCILAIDLGGTSVKFGVVTFEGRLSGEAVVSTNVMAGPAGLLDQIIAVGRRFIHVAREKGCAPLALGLGEAGWIDSQTCVVVYRTNNLPDWTGALVAAALALDRR